MSVCSRFTGHSSRPIFKLHTQAGSPTGRNRLVLGENRSKANQDVSQSSQIQHCEIGHFLNCLRFQRHAAAAGALALYRWPRHLQRIIVSNRLGEEFRLVLHQWSIVSMIVCLSVCLSVCLLAILRKNCWTYLPENFKNICVCGQGRTY